MSKHQWTIVEGDGPRRTYRPRGEYAALWREMLLRLEVTPAHKSLDVQGGDNQDALRIYAALYKRAAMLGAGVVKISREGARVIVQRGPNWSKREAGSLAHLPAHPLDLAEYNEHQRERRAQRANGKPGRPRTVKTESDES